jgi:hypothetical protein
MVLNPAPGGDDPTLQLPLGVPPAEPQMVAPRGVDEAADDALEETSESTAEHVDGEPAQLPKAFGENDFVSGPMVPRIEALSAEACRSRADKPLDALSPMQRAPVLDLGIEVATRVAPSDLPAKTPSDVPSQSRETSAVASARPGEVASQEIGVMLPEEAADDIASSEPQPTGDLQTLAPEPHSPSPAQVPVRQSKTTAPGIEPLASALDAAVQLATDASVAAEALEKLKVLLQHKQQLEDLRSAQPGERKQQFHASRSTQPVFARPSLSAEASASEAHAIAVPGLPPPLPSLPLPVPAAQASIARTGLPLLRPRRGRLFERRGLDVRGFLAGFALSWAFGVVLYFFMSAG